MQGTKRLEWLKGNLKNLNKTGLNLLIKDAQLRITSHNAGSNPVGEYISYQQSLIDLVQEELNERLESGQ